ncbi:helix-turn-helix transcriptional regulator [uncultured Kordia sp.]|uniref:helix-turn-helix domain-containing protein n=1 Tax=uncultured Kordia sp. TaxID=507699 RepID=UPI00263601B6|nr:helix-turn-helix transcriptional regulator [uncultured Kordia sp.]
MSLTKEEQNFIKKLGKNIVAIREKKEIKQKELSDLLDMDDGSLRRIESGRTNPTTTTLLKVAKALEISVSELLDFDY